MPGYAEFPDTSSAVGQPDTVLLYVAETGASPKGTPVGGTDNLRADAKVLTVREDAPGKGRSFVPWNVKVFTDGSV